MGKTEMSSFVKRNKDIRKALRRGVQKYWLIAVLGITSLLVVFSTYVAWRTEVKITDISWTMTAKNECSVSFTALNTSRHSFTAHIPIYIHNIHWEGGGKYKHEVSTLLSKTSLYVPFMPHQSHKITEPVTISPWYAVTTVNVYVANTSERPRVGE